MSNRHPFHRRRPIVLLARILLVAGAAVAQPTPLPPDQIDPGGPVDFARTVVLFYSESCSHCHEEILFLDSIKGQYPDLQFVQIEVDETNNEANQAFFEKIMLRLDSKPESWPRTVIGGRVYVGFADEAGPLQWIDSYAAWAGYQNQMLAAIDELNGGTAGAGASPGGVEARATAGSLAGAGGAAAGGAVAGAWRKTARAAGGAAAALIAYALIAFLLGRRGSDAARRFWIGGGILLALAALFLVATTIPTGVIAGRAGRWPFPVMVTVIALMDGFNPCAFTVLFILLSLLTHARRRRDMIVVGGVFVGTSAAVYFAFIVAMVAVGSFALSSLGSWVLRVVGAIVLCMGVLSFVELFRHRATPVTSLSADQKARLGSRAGSAVRRFLAADTPGKRVASIGGVVVLAVVVNGVELGCTAILPAVYMSTLLTRYGTELSAAHVGWTVWYAFVYVLPMVAIVADFVVTFRSRRVDETVGRRLKAAAAGVMILFGGILAAAPNVLL